jgi:hypothetical protein
MIHPHAVIMPEITGLPDQRDADIAVEHGVEGFTDGPGIAGRSVRKHLVRLAGQIAGKFLRRQGPMNVNSHEKNRWFFVSPPH